MLKRLMIDEATEVVFAEAAVLSCKEEKRVPHSVNLGRGDLRARHRGAYDKKLLQAIKPSLRNLQGHAAINGVSFDNPLVLILTNIARLPLRCSVAANVPYVARRISIVKVCVAAAPDSPGYKKRTGRVLSGLAWAPPPAAVRV
jgi:hypothetical protein